MHLKPDSEHTKEHNPEGVVPPDDVKIIAPDSGGHSPRNPNDPLLLHLTLDAGKGLVNQVTRTVFHLAGNESLYAIVESFLMDVTWVEVFSRHNYTASPIQETVRVLTR